MPKPSMQSDVTIVKIPKRQVAHCRSVSRSARKDAWKKITNWAKVHDLELDPESTPLFGIDNPPPSLPYIEYAHECIVPVSEDISNSYDEDVEIEDQQGGIYAVTTTCLSQTEQVKNELCEWCEKHGYDTSQKECLQEYIDPAHEPHENTLVNLYIPLEKKMHKKNQTSQNTK